MYDEKNTDCALYGTEECALLNAEGCLQCAAGKLKPEQQQAMREALARLREAAPEETVRSLYEGGECMLCKGEERGSAECFALFDMVRPDENGDWTYTLKKSAAAKSGAMVLPIQAASCKKCRARYRRAEFLPTVVGLVIAGLGLLLTTLKGVYERMYNAAPWLPAAVFAAFVAAALLTAYLMRRSLIKKYSRDTHFDVSELEPVARLMENGWREVEKKSAGASRMVFANKLREHGVYSPKPEPQSEFPAE